MNKITVQGVDNKLIWDRCVDKSCPHILLYRFNPNYVIEWWQTSVRLKNGAVLKDILVNDMTFDARIDLSMLQEILENTVYYLSIYQFKKDISPKLTMNLPEEQKHSILKQNGLEHIIEINHDTTTIYSHRDDHLEKIKRDPEIADYIIP